MSEETELRAVVRLLLDTAAQQATVQGVAAVDRGIRTAGDSADDTNKRLDRLRNSAERLRNIGLTIAGAGAAIAGPLALALNTYISKAGTADSASRRWLQSSRDIEQSQMRIGREVATTLLPVLERAAELARIIANTAEQNPALVQAGLGAAAGLVAVGTGLAVVAQLTATAVSVANAAASLGISGATLATATAALTAAWATGTTALTAAATVLAGVLAQLAGPLAAVVAGASVYENYTRNMTGPQILGNKGGPLGLGMGPSLTELPGQLATIVATSFVAGIGKVMGGEAGMLQAARGGHAMWGNAVRGVNSVFNGTAGTAFDNWRATASAPPVNPVISQDQANATSALFSSQAKADADYRTRQAQTIKAAGARIVQIEQQAGQQRTQVVSAFNRAATREAEDYNRGRLRAVQDFLRQEAETEAAYYAARLDRAASFGVDTARMEQDHQRDMARAREDYQASQKDLADSRDGLGMLRAKRQYDVDRRRAEEDYQVQAGRRNEDYGRQLADEEQHFSDARDQRQQEFDRRQRDEADDYALRRKRAKEDLGLQLAAIAEQAARQREEVNAGLAEQLKDMEAAHGNEKSERALHYKDVIDELGLFLGNERELRLQLQRLMGEDFEEWAQSLGFKNFKGEQSKKPAQEFAAGGYARQRNALMDPGEFVLAPDTTAAAEGIMGGALTQGGMLAALAGSRGGMGGPSLHQEFVFNGRLAEDEKQQYRSIAHEAALSAFNAVLERVI